MEFDKKVQKILTDLGLSELQADFYIALLKRGGAPVSKISKDLGINRTNAYVIIDKLKALDLIWEENKPLGKVIHAKSYENVLKALNDKEKEIFSHKQSVHDLIPVFNSF